LAAAIATSTADENQIVFIFNFFEHLRRITPAAQSR
jgi:hypothetical protein